MTNLNQLALEYYKKNVELIKREGGPSYSEWDIHELLEEEYEEQKGA